MQAMAWHLIGELQAITWTNVDQVPWIAMLSPGADELMYLDFTISSQHSCDSVNSRLFGDQQVSDITTLEEPLGYNLLLALAY